MKKINLKEVETVIGYLAIVSVAEKCGKDAYKALKATIKGFKKKPAAEEEITEL